MKYSKSRKFASWARIFKVLQGPYGRVTPLNGARQKGFTMVELLISIAITAVVAGALYSVYNTFFRQTRIQDLELEAQQNARAAINLMDRELVNAGYAAGTADVITEATANSVEFIYKDPELNPLLSDTFGSRLKVKYALSTVGGVQYLVRNMGICSNLDCTAYSNTRQDESVIPDVKSLTITYYNIDGTTIPYADIDNTASPVEQANRNNIRFVSVNLETETKYNLPGTNSKKAFMVETHVRMRNMGIGQSAQDTTPPSTPTFPQVRDPGVCGRLMVAWTESPEGDVAGYRIFYGTGGAFFGIKIPLTAMTAANYNCTKVGNTIQCTIYPTTPPLAHSPSDGSSVTTYQIAIQAYDTSENQSAWTAQVSGNPAVNQRSFADPNQDSTINVSKPAAVAGFIGADGATEGQTLLNWDAYSDTGVVGFRVYRTTQPFASYPIDPADPNIDWIAGEPGSTLTKILDSSATTVTDDTGATLGCKTYYYAIAPVNCDTTLITDDAGDTDNERYVSSDYDVTFGDGTGPGSDSPAGSDTAPFETVGPAPPVINARAGWKRVALSLTQSPDSDFDQTCLYANEGAAYPGLLGTKDALKCYNIDTAVTPDATLVPDSGGVFTVAELPVSQSTSFWHDSMTEETPVAPSLLDVGTYSYRAVAFDLCGNGSIVTGAQATTILCGEDPPSGEKPPAVTNVQTSCCDTPVTLSWTGVSSDLGQPSSPSNPYDLAGYRVFRSTSVDFSTSVMLSGVAPFWGTSFNDASVTDGGTYYYRIVTTDCPYEKTNPSEATIRADMISGYLNSVMVGPITPGKIDRDEKCPGAGSCTKDDHRKVLTGVDIDNPAGNGTGSSSPDPSFTHDTVTLFFDNTSAGSMTIQSLDLAWVNAAAELTKVTIGGGRSGAGETFTNVTASPSIISGNPPYTRGLSGITLTAATIPGIARYVPITFEFEDSLNNPVDMRNDQLLVTLYIRNDSTGTISCESYLTVSQNPEGVAVPFGPSVTATQQDQPSNPTFSFAVPGPTGLNTVPSGSNGAVVVDGRAVVVVSTSALSNTIDASTGSLVPISSVKLYYKATLNTVTTAPTTGFTEVVMTSAGGNIWTGNIPAQDGKRVWYYIVAEDADGNFDRDPEIDDGAYVYDQKVFDVCDVTPSAVIDLTASLSGTTDVNLSWTGVTTYTNGGTIDPSDTILYRIFRTNLGVTTQIGTDQAATTYTDTGLAAGIYTYTVNALNSCAVPGPISAQAPIPPQHVQALPARPPSTWRLPPFCRAGATRLR